MCKGIKGKERDALFINDIEYYNYLNSTGCTTVETINDREMYSVVLSGLRQIFGEETYNILEIFSAVLLFGNVQIEATADKEYSKVTSLEIIEKIGNLLKIAPKRIEDALTKFVNEQFERFYSKEKAIDSRNACAKTLYSTLFKYIFDRINEKFKEMQTLKGNELLLGILDIYGFEVLEANSFEQLCINFASEKIHQHFLVHTFKLEQALYQNQGIDITTTIFKDNEPIIQLIENNLEGIFSCIEDEIRMPKGSDEKLLSRMNANYQSRKGVYAREIKNPKSFKIFHYTAPVIYKITNFLEKAKDEISWNILEMFGDSNHPILKKTFVPSSKLTAKVIQKMKLNIGIQYKNEMGSLIEKMDRGEVRYLKCILANRDKRPMQFEHSIVREQLRANGVLETVDICQKGFSVKLSIGEFAKKYKPLAKSKKDASVQDILGTLGNYDKNQIRLGKDLIFLKKESEIALDAKMKKTTNKAYSIIKRCNG